MAVDDGGLEAIRKAAEQVTPGSPADYYIKTDAQSGGLLLAKLQEILDAVDELEGFTDGLEGFTDGIEGLLTTLNGLVDQLEGFVDGIEASLISIDTKSTRAFSSGSNTRPTVTTTSSEILASNSSRKYANIYNGSGTAIYIKFGATAVANEGIRISSNEMFEITNDKLWTGAVNAIRVASTGAIEVFEGT